MWPRPERAGARITAVIFDMDDTLIDWSGQEIFGAEIGQRHLRRAYTHLAGQGFDLPAPEDFFDSFGNILVRAWAEAKQTWAGVSLADVLAQTLAAAGLEPGQVDMEALLRVYEWEPVPGVRPFPDTLPVLQTLKRQGYKIGLVTNAMQPMWMRDVELENYGILPYLDARITSGDTGHMKPHPAIYRRILALLEVEEPARAVFVGDRPENDIAGANEAGLTSVLITPNHLRYDLKNVRPDYTINRLAELLPILADLEQAGDGQKEANHG